jgi:hypothetical protein
MLKKAAEPEPEPAGDEGLKSPIPGQPLLADDGEPALLATTERIRAYRQKYHHYPADRRPAVDERDENTEMRDSALFDVVVEVNFYDGRRIRIPQQSTPADWVSPF